MQMMQQQAMMQASLKDSNKSLHFPKGQLEMNELLKHNETTANFLKSFRQVVGLPPTGNNEKKSLFYTPDQMSARKTLIER